MVAEKERAQYYDIPDFSSTVPLPATYEAAFVSPRNNTTLHMFSRYSE